MTYRVPAARIITLNVTTRSYGGRPPFDPSAYPRACSRAHGIAREINDPLLHLRRCEPWSPTTAPDDLVTQTIQSVPSIHPLLAAEMRRPIPTICAGDRLRDGCTGCLLFLGVTEDPTHHRRPLVFRHCLPPECVTEVVSSHVLQFGCLANPPPRLLKVGQMCALAGAVVPLSSSRENDSGL